MDRGKAWDLRIPLTLPVGEEGQVKKMRTWQEQEAQGDVDDLADLKRYYAESGVFDRRYDDVARGLLVARKRLEQLLGETR